MLRNTMILFSKLKIKSLLSGILIINSINLLSASEINNISSQDVMILNNNCIESFKTPNDSLNTDDIRSPKKDANEEIEKEETEKNDKSLSHYEENTMNSVRIHDMSNDDSNNVIEKSICSKSNKNKYSKNKQQYFNLQKDLNSINVKPFMTLREPNTKKLSGISSYFSNPVTVKNQNEYDTIDNYFKKYKELIPIIVLQSDGMQVRDTIAHLLAFNDFYNINNFGTSPYIYCASSAAIPGLSLAYDLSNNVDPMKKLNSIGNTLYKTSNSDKQQSNNKKKCCCNMNIFKLCWLNTFGCCIDYDDETIIDSLYSKIKNNKANSIIKNIIGLTKESEINLPNFIIEDAKTNNNVVETVLQANSNQNTKAVKNQVKLFTDPLVAIIKKYLDNNKDSKYNDKLEKGANFINNNIQNNDLSKITYNEELQFIKDNNLHNNRLAIILSSDVDNTDMQSDMNDITVECEELEYKELNDKLHAIRINIVTYNSLTNPNYYSLEQKYNNIKSMLNNSKQFLHVIENLPHTNSSNDSSDISDDGNNNIENIDSL
ncbi:MAG: hypothetical protein IJ848_04260 [Alphaproteobacteria bacterium]|nr:hypothetical protein [Alphaproteobacteria bacterium]